MDRSSEISPSEIDGNSTKWHSSLGYNKCMENVEMIISEKLEIPLLETKIMLNSKKKGMKAVQN